MDLCCILSFYTVDSKVLNCYWSVCLQTVDFKGLRRQGISNENTSRNVSSYLFLLSFIIDTLQVNRQKCVRYTCSSIECKIDGRYSTYTNTSVPIRYTASYTFVISEVKKKKEEEFDTTFHNFIMVDIYYVFTPTFYYLGIGRYLPSKNTNSRVRPINICKYLPTAIARSKRDTLHYHYAEAMVQSFFAKEVVLF